MLNKTIGIVYPIPPNIIEKIKEKNCVVFCKMAAHESIPKEIGPGNKLFFYESKGSKSILGESEIQKLKLLNYSQILSQKIENMVQTREELRDYVGGRIEKEDVSILFEKNYFFMSLSLEFAIV